MGHAVCQYHIYRSTSTARLIHEVKVPMEILRIGSVSTRSQGGFVGRSSSTIRRPNLKNAQSAGPAKRIIVSNTAAAFPSSARNVDIGWSRLQLGGSLGLKTLEVVQRNTTLEIRAIMVHLCKPVPQLFLTVSRECMGKGSGCSD